jgi:pimeloyl-ACP methyl ester carboxylesterase
MRRLYGRRMVVSQVLSTRLGAVEVVHLPGDKPPVLFFPGGHCSAVSDCGWSLYRDAGHALLAFSRPGYGRTAVGRLNAGEFVPAVSDCCDLLGVRDTSAVVGVSFGGLQAIQVAVNLPRLAPRLVLHSCAPSTHSYPDSRREALGGPIVFAPTVQRLTWRTVSRLVASDAGLRRMVAALSKQPIAEWWHTWSDDDKGRAREMFTTMDSGSGFVYDLQQGRSDRATHRRLLQTQVACPTLVTASRQDAGVDFTHAQDLSGTIPAATLVELGSPSHLFWIGPERSQAQAAVNDFIPSGW